MYQKEGNRENAESNSGQPIESKVNVDQENDLESDAEQVGERLEESKSRFKRAFDALSETLKNLKPDNFTQEELDHIKALVAAGTLSTIGIALTAAGMGPIMLKLSSEFNELVKDPVIVKDLTVWATMVGLPGAYITSLGGLLFRDYTRGKVRLSKEKSGEDETDSKTENARTIKKSAQIIDRSGRGDGRDGPAKSSKRFQAIK